MAPDPIVVTLSRDIEDLVPVFLAQRKADIEGLKVSIPSRDFDAVRRVGHGMAGSGASYGFDHLSVIGDRIVTAARAADVDSLNRLHHEFDDYMSRLVVKYL